MREDLRTFAAAFPSGSKWRLVVYVIVQFISSLFELVGIAAVLPILQVLSGAPLDEGYIATLHEWLGSPERGHFVVLLCVATGLAFLTKAVLSMASQWWSLGFITRMQVHISRTLIGRYMNTTYLDQRARDTGEAVRTVGGAAASALNNVVGGFMSLATTALTVFMVLGFLIWVMPVPALVALVYLGLSVVVIQGALSGPNRRAGKVSQHANWESTLAMIEAINGFREIKMHNAQKHAVGRFDAANRRAAAAARQGAFLSGLPKQILELVTVLGLMALLGVVAARDIPAEQLVPTLGVIVAATFKLMPPVIGATATLGAIRLGHEALHVTAEALRRGDAPEVVVTDDTVDPLSSSPLPLVIDDVNFKYPDGVKDVLTNVSIHVPAGSSLALSGPSGSGKTTLADTILGLIPPDEGSIRFGDIDVHGHEAQWHKTIAYVPQDVHIFDTTVRENVAFGVASELIDDNRVLACLRQAELQDWVEGLPDGINGRVGERGKRMSGGQRQRLGIARALYRNPMVMVLDEATSALDNETESRIASAIASLRGQVTTIIVAHRLSTVRDVDNLVYMEQGRVVASGTFTEVQRRSPAFARLVELGALEVASD